MKITDGAKQLLEKILAEKGAKGIRLFAVAGCCGPQFTISLDAPQEANKVETINGIKVAFDSRIPATDDLILETEENENGEGLVLLGGGGCC